MAWRCCTGVARRWYKTRPACRGNAELLMRLLNDPSNSVVGQGLRMLSQREPEDFLLHRLPDSDVCYDK